MYVERFSQLVNELSYSLLNLDEFAKGIYKTSARFVSVNVFFTYKADFSRNDLAGFA